MHTGSQIISETAPKKFVDKLMLNFNEMKVNVIFNQKVTLSDEDKKFDREIKVEPKTYQLSGGITSFHAILCLGSSIDADLLINCTGFRPNNAILTNNFADKLNVKSSANLQLICAGKWSIKSKPIFPSGWISEHFCYW